MKVGITYNLKSEISELEATRPRTEDMAEEFDSPETIQAIRKVLEEMGHSCQLLGYGQKAIEKILKDRPDFVFNIAEGYYGRSREAHMPALLEMLDIPFSGPGPLTAGISLDKICAKKLALSVKIPTPGFVEVEPDIPYDLQNLAFPLIVKPAYEGSSIGIRQDSKVDNEQDLNKKIKWLKKNYPGQPVVIEQFIAGREFTVGVLGNRYPKILGVMEIIPRDIDLENFVYSLEVKRNYKEKIHYSLKSQISDFTRKQLEHSALKLFKVFGCRDISRFDFRIDDFGVPQFLEVNTLPGLNPLSSDLVIMALLKGMGYGELIKRIFELAMERYK
jgi:D-alanine-D-alanine ligase